jgi:dephospho-CoA kinase
VTHVFALTGGLGSGKSTVLARFLARGLPVINADDLARAVVEPGRPALTQIVQTFGPRLLKADGTLDRKALAARVFADPSAREKLEAITHPQIRALADAQFRTLDARGEPLACYEVPLLFEAGLESQYSPSVVVHTPEAIQVERAALRDRTSEEDVRARILAQLPLAEKVDRADYVIDNSGPLDDTFQQADRVLDSICERLGIDASRYPIPD